MLLRGHHRIWSWLVPVFSVSDEELLLSAGMDALIGVRIISFGVLLFLPITVAALAILIPINYLDDYYIKSGQSAGVTDAYTTVFIRMTMSNLTPGTPLMWIHFVFVYAAVFWTCWLITEHYKEYVTLRQAYVVRSTVVPGVALGGSTEQADGGEVAPLIGCRSPMKRKHMLASFSSGGGGAARGTSTGTVGQSGSRKVRRAGSVRLPRRDASGSSNTAETINNTVGQQQQQQQQLQQQQMMAMMMNGGSSPTAAFRRQSHRSRLSGPVQPQPQQSPPPPPQPPCIELTERGMTSQPAPDWTTHDFSTEVQPPEQQQQQQQHQLQRINSGNVMVPIAPIARMVSNAAVVAALEGGSAPVTAAEALAKIRHHRALSGASAKSSSPPGGSTPRLRDTGEGVGGEYDTMDSNSNDNEGAAVSGASMPEMRPFPLPPLARTRSSNSGSKALVPPPDLAGIIQKVLVFANKDDERQQQQGHDAGGGLPTCAALAPELASPQGQEGVAHRWWNALSTRTFLLVFFPFPRVLFLSPLQ